MNGPPVAASLRMLVVAQGNDRLIYQAGEVRMPMQRAG